MIDWEDEAFNRRMFQAYKVTDDPMYCGWLLPDGRMLNFIEGANGQAIMSHLFVGFFLDKDGEAAIDEFASSGAIRHQHNHNAALIMRKPTDIQMARLADLFMCHYKSGGWISGRTQLHMAGNGKDFFKHYPLGTNPSYVLADVRDFWPE